MEDLNKFLEKQLNEKYEKELENIHKRIDQDKAVIEEVLDLILNSKNFNVKDFPTITVNDKVSRNEDNINILDENTNRVFDMVTALEPKVEELVSNVEDIRNHLRTNSERITHFQNGLSGCENRVDNIEDKIADMCAELSRHKTTIKDFTEDINKIKAGLRCMYDNINSSLEGVCEGQNDIKERLDRIKKHLGGEVNDADHITTFGELKVRDKFKLSNDPVPYIKVRNVGYGYLAYNAVLARCYAIQDDYPVIPIAENGG